MDGAVFCVSSIDQSRLPNAAKKEILNRKGLGLKENKTMQYLERERGSFCF